MKKNNFKKITQLVDEANAQIRGIEQVAKKDTERAYGGIIRAGKGGLVEFLGKELVKIAWNELGGKASDLSFSSQKIPIPLKKDYIAKIKSPEVKQWIERDYTNFIFNAQVDIHVLIQKEFVLGIECKAYTENAMLKRILVDFTLLKIVYPQLQCGLLQLESQLSGDYSKIHQPLIYGSHSTHTLMSYFDVNLNIITLLEGERKVYEPIHKADFFKPLESKVLVKTVEEIKILLKNYKKEKC